MPREGIGVARRAVPTAPTLIELTPAIWPSPTGTEAGGRVTMIAVAQAPVSNSPGLGAWSPSASSPKNETSPSDRSGTPPSRLLAQAGAPAQADAQSGARFSVEQMMFTAAA